MKHFCLALPEGMHDKAKSCSQQRGVTLTAYFRQAIAARLQSDLTGQRFCSTGAPCILAMMPDYKNMASTAKMLLDTKSVLTGV